MLFPFYRNLRSNNLLKIIHQVNRGPRSKARQGTPKVHSYYNVLFFLIYVSGCIKFFIVSCGVFTVVHRLPHDIEEPSSPTRDLTHVSSIAKQILNQ